MKKKLVLNPRPVSLKAAGNHKRRFKEMLEVDVFWSERLFLIFDFFSDKKNLILRLNFLLQTRFPGKNHNWMMARQEISCCCHSHRRCRACPSCPSSPSSRPHPLHEQNLLHLFLWMRRQRKEVKRGCQNHFTFNCSVLSVATDWGRESESESVCLCEFCACALE